MSHHSVHAAESRPQRLAATDLAVLWPEDHGWPQDLGLLAMLDAAALRDADGRFRVDAVRRHVAGRLAGLPPRFRKRLVRPPVGLGGPYWVDVADLDVAAHVHEVAVPPPGDETALLAACERLRRSGLDRSRPLWQLSFLTGMRDGRVAMLLQAHHCVVDGTSGVAAFAAFVDAARPSDVRASESADPRTSPTDHVPPSVPAPPPSTATLLADALRRHARTLLRTLSTVAHAGPSWARTVDDVRAWRRGMGGGPTAVTSLNRRPIGPDRRLALVRSDLARLTAVAHAHDATVNDVLLCAVAGGLRALLSARGERIDDLVLRAAVPVALHGRRGTASAEGNADGGLLLRLPVGEPDDVIRLRRIAAHTVERKRNAVMPGATRGVFTSPLAQRLLVRLTAHQRASNTYVANVPGPPVRLSIAGATIAEMFPVVPLLGNISLGVGALSYAGQFNLALVADRDTCPDIDIAADGIRRSLTTMATAAAS